MKKIKVFILTICLLLLCAVTACDGENDGKKHIIFYAWGNNLEIANIQTMVDDFNSKNEDIVVEIERSTSDDNAAAIKGRFSTKSEPDIFYIDPGEISAFIRNGYILDLTDYINQDGGLEENDLWEYNDLYRYNEKGIRDKNGKLYGVIKDLSPDFMLFYNKSHIDEYNRSHPNNQLSYPSETIPMTWYEYMELAKKMTIRNGNTFQRYGTVLNYVPIKHLTEMIQQTGTSVFNKDYTGLNITNSQIDEKMFEAFQFFYDLQVGSDAPSQYVASSLISPGDMFRNGEVFSVFYGRWAVVAYDWDIKDIGIAPPPVYERVNNNETDNYGVTSGTIGYAISSRTKYPAETYKFLEYCMTDGAEFMAEIGFNVPGNKTIAKSTFINVEDPDAKKLNELFVWYLENYTHVIETSPYISANKFDQIIYQELAKAYQGKQTLSAAIKVANGKILTETELNKKKMN